jgi:hypothetical protein
VGLALRRSGASVGSAIAFTLGNPTLNLAVIAWIALAIGWQWAALRLVVGAILVFGAAALASRFSVTSAVPPETVSESLEFDTKENWVVRWLRSLFRFAVVLVPMMVVLVVVLGAARAFLFPAIGVDWGNSPVAVVAFALAGALFPIPTGAEIPIIQTMMGFGLGAGPAGALLLTLSPISVASMAMLTHGFPVRMVLLLGALTVLAGIVAGTLAIVFGL